MTIQNETTKLTIVTSKELEVNELRHLLQNLASFRDEVVEKGNG